MAESLKSARDRRLTRMVTLAILLGVVSVHGWSQKSAPKEPEQIARWVVESVWNRGDFRLAGRMFNSTWILHYRGRDFPLTPESGVQTVRNWRAAFPDFHFTIEDMIVQGNKVVLRIPSTATHKGKFWGVEPTGNKSNYKSIGLDQPQLNAHSILIIVFPHLSDAPVFDAKSQRFCNVVFPGDERR